MSVQIESVKATLRRAIEDGERARTALEKLEALERLAVQPNRKEK